MQRFVPSGHPGNPARSHVHVLLEKYANPASSLSTSPIPTAKVVPQGVEDDCAAPPTQPTLKALFAGPSCIWSALRVGPAGEDDLQGGWGF